MANFYAAMSGKIVQNVFVSQWYLQNRQFGTQFRSDYFAPSMRNSLPFQGGKLAWTSVSSMHLRTLSKYQSGFANRGTFHCNGLFQTLAIQVDIKCKKINIFGILDASFMLTMCQCYFFPSLVFIQLLGWPRFQTNLL